jgi:hypothetical protein
MDRGWPLLLKFEEKLSILILELSQFPLVERDLFQDLIPSCVEVCDFSLEASNKVILVHF